MPIFSKMDFRSLNFLLIGLLVFSSSSFAQPFLWKATESSTGTKVYLFGTIHSGNPAVNQFDNTFLKAFNESRTLLTEVDMSQSNLQLMQESMITPDPKPLKLTLGSTRVEKTNQALKLLNSNLNIDFFQQLSLWAFVANLSFLEDQIRFPGLTPMDLALHQKANARGMETAGLETIDEQINIFTQLSEHELLAILDASVEVMIEYFSAGKSPMDEIYNAYNAGDSEAFKRIMDEQMPMDEGLNEKLNERLITNRNQLMAERIAQRFQQYPQPIFIAIGAGHLDREYGVQTLLSDKGWQVQPLSQ